MQLTTIILSGILWVVHMNPMEVQATTRDYQASFRNLGAAASGSAVSHLQVPLAIPDILQTFSRTYVALTFVTDLAKKYEAAKSTIRELDNAQGNLRALLSEFVTTVKTFVPAFHLPPGDVVHKLSRTVTPIKHHRLIKDISRPGAYDQELTSADHLKPYTKAFNEIYGDGSNTDPEKQEKPRQKRQLALALLTVLNIGAAAYTTSQISTIHHGLDQLEKTTHMLGAQLSLQAHKLNLVIHDTKILEGTVELLMKETAMLKQRVVLETFIRDVLHTTDRVLNEVTTFNTGLSFLAVGRLHPSLLNATALAGAFEDITRQALEANFRPIRNDPMVVFDSPVSVYAEKNRVLDTVQLLIHVPLLQGAASTIYQFLGNPLLVDDPSGSLALVNFRPAKPYLLLDEQQGLAVELSEAEFRRCRPYPFVYHCPEITYLHKDPSNLCLYALFTNQEPQQICPMSFSKTEEIIRMISPGSFFISTVEDIQISRSYFAAKGEPAPPVTFEPLAKGTHFVEMDEKTKLITTPHHVIKNHFSITAVEQVLQKNFTFTVSALFQDHLVAPHLTTNWTQHLDFSNVKEINVEDFRNKLRVLETEYKLSQQTSWFTILWISLVALLGILGCYFIFIKCSSWKTGRATRRPQEKEWTEESVPLRPLKDLAFHEPPSRPRQPTSPLPSPPVTRAQIHAPSIDRASSFTSSNDGPSSFQQGLRTVNLDTIDRGQTQQRQRQVRKPRIIDPFPN